MNAPDGQELVTLQIPAATKHIRVARTVAASIAADLDFSADRIEELRIAVDEIVSLLVEAAPGGKVEISFQIVDDTRIEMNASIPGGSVIEVPPLTAQIIRAVADDVRIEDHSGWFCMQNVS